jgi:hypothetical protein
MVKNCWWDIDAAVTVICQLLIGSSALRRLTFYRNFSCDFWGRHLIRGNNRIFVLTLNHHWLRENSDLALLGGFLIQVTQLNGNATSMLNTFGPYEKLLANETT